MCKRFLYLGFIAVLTFPAAAQRNRITAPLQGARVPLRGGIHPRAQAEFDQGRVDPNLVLSSVTMVLKPSDAQEAALEKLLTDQQNPASPDYHRWLTPEQFADRFGASAEDIATLVSWAQNQGLEVVGTARARNSIALRGSAAQISQAFGTEIHRFVADGQEHFANSTEPTVPAAFEPVVRGIRGLNNFRMRPQHRLKAEAVQPAYTNSAQRHYLAPADVTTLYNVRPLYSAGIAGDGQKIAVVGQTQVNVADIQQFRSRFGLPASDPRMIVVPNFRDPGISSDDLPEADLDIEWAGAMAPNAQIVYVYSYDITDAVQYAIDQNYAPILSMSYGSCEALTATSDVLTLRAMARQANAEGMTWVNSSGDNGGADCAGNGTRFDSTLAVDLPAAVPEVTGIGGTEFDEGTGNYWNGSNDGAGGSVLGRIPETTWNDSTLEGSPAAGGGGASVLFPKPAWQAGPGVPNDGARDVPDVSLSASASHDGFLIYSKGTLQVVGGTSVSAPIFAGMLALVNQQSAGAGLGNVNPKLYTLAQSSPAAFHDITTGDNIVNITCTRTRNCTPGSYGFPAGAGYDQATGLGSIDAVNLVAAWTGGTLGGGTPAASTPPVISGMTNGASFDQIFAPGMLLSIFGSQLASSTASAGSVPLPAQLGGASVTINGVNAPFYYASATQLNVQIPYETPSNSSAVLVVNNGGLTASAHLGIASVAPGIFADSNGAPVPNSSGSRGQTLVLYFTGGGLQTPSIATGAAPSPSTAIPNLPRPSQSVGVSVGGVPAQVQFVGTPAGLVGVTQLNYTVPANAPLGVQNVIVSVGGIPSSAVKLNVTN